MSEKSKRPEDMQEEGACQEVPEEGADTTEEPDKDFERGLASAEEGDAFAEGMQMVYKQLMAALSEIGVQPIEALGQVFDPNFHNAVMHVEDPEAGDNKVVE